MADFNQLILIDTHDPVIINGSETNQKLAHQI